MVVRSLLLILPQVTSFSRFGPRPGVPRRAAS